MLLFPLPCVKRGGLSPRIPALVSPAISESYNGIPQHLRLCHTPLHVDDVLPQPLHRCPQLLVVLLPVPQRLRLALHGGQPLSGGAGDGTRRRGTAIRSIRHTGERG
jgi:hypothetical protein